MTDTNLEIIQSIGLANGQVVQVEDLPQEIQQLINKYNSWTGSLSELMKQATNIEEQIELIMFARSGAYSAIHSAISNYQTDLLADEASPQSTPNEANSTDSQDQPG